MPARDADRDPVRRAADGAAARRGVEVVALDVVALDVVDLEVVALDVVARTDVVFFAAAFRFF